MVGARTSLAHGPSRIVWVYRNRGAVALAIGCCRSATSFLGRYDLMMARYGEAWPVTLTRDEDAEDERMMVVTGRVPL